MTTFNKMALVDAEELNRLRDKKITQYNPTVRTLATLDSEMESVLRERNLEPEEKLARYNAALLHFKNMYSNNTRSIPPTAVAAALVPPAAIPPDPPAPLAIAPAGLVPFDLKTALSERDKTSLRGAIDHIEFFPEIISNAPTGEAIIHDTLIPGSNLADLMRSLNSGSRSLNRTGQDQLVSALAETKFSHTLAKNPKISGLIKREAQSLGLDGSSTRAASSIKLHKGHGRPSKRIRFVTAKKSKSRPPGVPHAQVYRLYRA